MPRSTIHPPQSEAPTQVIKPAGPTVAIGWQYFWAVMIPLVGVALSVRRFSKQDLGNGFGLLVTSVGTCVLLWVLVAAASAKGPVDAPGWKVTRAQAIAEIVWHHPCQDHVEVRWGSINAAAVTPGDEGTPDDPTPESCYFTLDTKGPGGLGDPWTWDRVCTYVIHEYGHLAGFKDWSNTTDPSHSANPNSVMYYLPAYDHRCDRRGLKYLDAHPNA